MDSPTNSLARPAPDAASHKSGSNHDWSGSDDDGDSSVASSVQGSENLSPSGAAVAGIESSPVGNDSNHPNVRGRNNTQDSARSPPGAGNSPGTTSSLVQTNQREELLEDRHSHLSEKVDENSDDDCVIIGESGAPLETGEISPARAGAAAETKTPSGENFTSVKALASQNKTQREQSAASEPVHASKLARASEAATPQKADRPASADKRTSSSQQRKNANSPVGSPTGERTDAKPSGAAPAANSEATTHATAPQKASASKSGTSSPAKFPAKAAESAVLTAGAKLTEVPAEGGEGKRHNAAPPPKKQEQTSPKTNPLVGRVGGGNHPNHPAPPASNVTGKEAKAANVQAAKGGEKRQYSPSSPPEKKTKMQGSGNAPAVISPGNTTTSNPAQQSEKLLAELQQKLAATENMLRATQERAGYQSELLTLHKEQIAAYRERSEDLAEQQQLQENIIFSMQQQAQAEPPKPSKFARLEDPQNAKRLEYLVGKGYTITEAMQALEDTRSPDGNFSSMRAETHLKATAEADQADVIRRANALSGDSAVPEILPNSAVAHLLGQHEDAVDIVTKLREVHAKSRAKAVHNAKTALSAAYLVESPSIKSDASLIRKGLTFLCQVASAVSEDCGKCKDLRDQLEQEARWAKEKEKAAALKAKNAEERKRLVAKHAEEQKRLREHKPHVVNFKVCDSKRDVTLPRGACGKCKQGWTDADKWLYYCGHCRKGFHVLCSVLTLIRYRDVEYFACSECLDDLEGKLHDGDSTPFSVIGSDIGRGKAPKHTEAMGEQAPPLPPPIERTLGGGAATRGNMFQTPPQANATTTRVDPSDQTSTVAPTGK